MQPERGEDPPRIGRIFSARETDRRRRPVAFTRRLSIALTRVAAAAALAIPEATTRCTPSVINAPVGRSVCFRRTFHARPR